MKRKLLALLIIPVILCGCNTSNVKNNNSHAEIMSFDGTKSENAAGFTSL